MIGVADELEDDSDELEDSELELLEL